ncbi:uncharacterized protein [Drosophila bipectinata]|uniref:uncharacterized protein isoform X2 n=1 Tax=Drosophila bipectinata TaxID=42026 RepID=UPI0038B39605
MTSSDNNTEDNAGYLSDDPEDEENRRILNSMESMGDIHQTYKSKSAQQLRTHPVAVESCDTHQQKAKSILSATCSSSRSEEKKCDTNLESDLSSFLKHTSLHYSHIRISSGQEGQETSQAMNYGNYSFNAASEPCCSWQSAVTQQQAPTLNETVSSADEVIQNGGYYTNYGPSLPECSSASNETIVNQPTMCAAPTAPSMETPSCSLESGCCCSSMRPTEQPPAEYSGQQQNVYQGHQSTSVDPSTGMAYYVYPGNGMYPATAMGMNQSQNQYTNQHGGQYTGGGVSNAMTAGPSTTQGSNAGYDMDAFMRKYQQSVQQCYATAQQGLQQTFAQVNSQYQPYLNSYGQGAQPYYVNPIQAPPPAYMQGSANQASQQFYGNTSQAQQPFSFQGMPQAFSVPLGDQAYFSPMGAQQFYSSSSISAQSYYPPTMSMPASSYFGAGGGFGSDRLQTQTVYSSDYKPYCTDGNHFNHFPNGKDIGLSPESCPGYSPVGTAGLAEMSAGGQVYGMGGGYEMDAGSYPLSHMGYSGSYNFDMPPLSAGYTQAPGVAMVSPNVSNNTPSGNPTQS